MKKLAMALLALCAAAAHADGELSLGTGFNYSSGDYGTSSETRITSIPVTARWERLPWILKLTVPYIRVEGDAAVIPGVGRVTGNTRAQESASGLGDVVGSATYAAYYNRDSSFGIDLTGKVKLGTADEGLGTGEEDVSLLVEPFKAFDRVALFGSVGYHLLGASRFVDVNDVWSWSAGASYKLDDRDMVGAAYDWRERVSSTSGELSEVTLFWSRKLDRQWKAQVYLLKGFSDGSPDWGGGLSVSYAF